MATRARIDDLATFVEEPPRVRALGGRAADRGGAGASPRKSGTSAFVHGRRFGVAAAFALLVAACTLAPPQAAHPPSPASQEGTPDPSPHKRRFLTVAEGVALEVLDWGGEGPALIFLTGLGDSAHVFDNFAPMFRDKFHVYGVTRRGFGASSQPKTGYDIATLGADLRAVLDGLGLARASLVGHSIAGEELTWFAANEPARVDKLVYLDAAYDRAARREAWRESPKMPPLPEPTDADKVSSATFRAYLERTYGTNPPDAEIRATYLFDARGRYLGDRMPPEIEEQITGSTLPPDYAHVTAPALAIYMVLESAEKVLTPSVWSGLSEADREKVRVWFDYKTKVMAREREQFRREVAQSRVVEIPGANHYVYMSHPELVAREMRDFLLR